LSLEALPYLGRTRKMFRKDLDRDGPVEARVPRLVDLPHASGADLREDLVGAESSARSNGQCGQRLQQPPRSPSVSPSRPTSWRAQMSSCWSCGIVVASLSKRWRASGVSDERSGSTVIATMRSNRVSRAL